MSIFKGLIHQLSCLLGVMTDWLLIIIGGLLIFKGVFAVDVTVARYIIITVGVMFAGFGLWYRHRRINRRHR